MILDRLDRAFDQVDIAYTEMYERHIKFEEYLLHLLIRNQENLPIVLLFRACTHMF